MDKLKEIIEEGYFVWMYEGQKGFYVGFEKRWEVDEFEEQETSEYPTIEEAINEAYKRIKEVHGE